MSSKDWLVAGTRIKIAGKPLARDWVSIVGEPTASNTWPDQIRYKKLYLLVRNSVWLHQLTYLKPATSSLSLQRVTGGELLTEVVLRVARSATSRRFCRHPPAMATTISEAVLAETLPRLSDTDPDLRLQFTLVISRNLRLQLIRMVRHTSLERMRVASEISCPFGMGPTSLLLLDPAADSTPASIAQTF
jgi:hypothetical protein